MSHHRTEPAPREQSPAIINLEAHRAKIQAAINKRREQNRQDEAELYRITSKIWREKLKALIGIPGAVKLRDRYPAGEKIAKHNDTVGTVVEVKRTRVYVAFGDDRWNLPADLVAPVSEEQGTFISLGGPK